MGNEPTDSRQSRKHDSPILGVSLRVGYDVRELLMMGCTHQEIAEVESGAKTLDDLLASKGQRRART